MEKLHVKLREWKPETAEEVRQRVSEIIELADHDSVDLPRSRAVEQELLALPDEPPGTVRLSVEINTIAT